MKLTRQSGLIFTSVAAFLIWSQLLWDHFHGGVPTHYLFQNGNLPGISNWWGALLLPIFVWFLLHLIQKRMESLPLNEPFDLVLKRFLTALCIAVIISFFFVHEIDVINYIMLAILLMAFVFPLYEAEYLLGWVLGSAFTFGAVIPIVFGSLLALVFFLLYGIPRSIAQWARTKKD